MAVWRPTVDTGACGPGTLDGMERDDDHDREAILARRTRLVALALAGMTSAAACRPSRPQPCLSPPMPTSEGAGEGGDALGDTDAAVGDEGGDGAGADAGAADAGAPPQPQR